MRILRVLIFTCYEFDNIAFVLQKVEKIQNYKRTIAVETFSFTDTMNMIKFVKQHKLP